MDMKLQFNESPIDRAIRVVLGLALALVAAVSSLSAPLLYVVWAVAAIAIVTAIVGVCPLYAILGFSTRRQRA
jgi:Inner membrane protein YgaP-like, transmembrane domain